MRKATIVKEWHISRGTAQMLVELIRSGKYDAVFIEGREENPMKDAKLSISYIFFLLGWVEWLLLRKFYASKSKAYKCAEEFHLPVYDKIDAPFYQIFEMANMLLKHALFPFIIVLSTILLLFTAFPCNLIGYFLLVF